jgi:gas vesicle protein
MAAWLTPALKAVIPHLGTIVSAVMPAFTRKKADAAANQIQLLQDQISELQSAVSQNSEYIKDLATQLQSTVAGLEQAAAVAENKIRQSLILSAFSITMSVISFAVAIFLLLTH